jgi:sulfide dehydrogenase cytochrome subunit
MMSYRWIGLGAALSFTLPCHAAVSRGELLASTCFGCHNESGSGKIPKMGKRTGHIIEEMDEFRSEEDEGTIMGRIARGYTEDEIRLMAEFLGGASK